MTQPWKKDGGSPEVAGPVPVSLLVEKWKAGHPARERNISPWRSSFDEEQPCSEISLGHTPCLGAERKTAESEH